MPESSPEDSSTSFRTTINRARAATQKAKDALLNPAGMRGVAIEAAWLTTHVAMYPFGLVEDKYRHAEQHHTLEGLPPVQRGLIIGDVEAAGTPIILIHGIIDNHTVFAFLRRALNRRGFGRVITLNYSPLSDDIPRVARRLKSLVEKVRRETGYERVHVIGHSMGGVVARYYVQCLGGDQRVHTLVTLGSPHSGTMPAYLVPHSVVKQMRPDSPVVQELDAPAPNCRTRMVAIWSDLDQMIIPKRNARIVHPDLNARNVFFRGVGHMSFPVDGRVVHEICTTLAQLDPDGSTLVRGTTSIGSSTGRVAESAPRQRRPQTTATSAAE
ncbi:MAG TPA: alpha/beta fold hydrolase [Actinomycetota bacterium]|nr:alpha/beta fold hydrolase [Actinomycetota bacterium]